MNMCHYCEFDFSDWFLLTFKLKNQKVGNGKQISVCEDCYCKYEEELCDIDD